MATLSSQRTGNTIRWLLQLSSRSRTIAFSFSSTERDKRARPYSSSSSSTAAAAAAAARNRSTNDECRRERRQHQNHENGYTRFARRGSMDSTTSLPARSRFASSHTASRPTEPSTRRFYATTAAPSTSSSSTRTQPQSSPSSSSSATRAAAARSASSYPTSKPTQAPREPPPPTQRSTANEASRAEQQPIRELSQSGLSDDPAASPASLAGTGAEAHIDWTQSFHGLSAQAFSSEASAILMEAINPNDIEIKPDGIIYLPEIKYRRILNRAFGPGGWGLAPRGQTIVTAKSVTREYALIVHGRLVSIARGEQDYFDSENIPTASEGCKSNALMRCCKDLGIASELWDPRFIRTFLAKNAKELWVEHTVTKKRRKIFMRKDDEVRYPFKEIKGSAA